MTLDQLKGKVRSFIGNAKTKEAIETIAVWAYENGNEQIKSDVSLLKGDLVALNREKNLGLLSSQEALVRQNKLNLGILNLLTDLEEAETGPDPEAKIKGKDLHAGKLNTGSIHPPLQERKTIKIFLASSNELKADRNSFELHFGARKRKTFIRDIEIILWEDSVNAMSRTRLQDEYNKVVKECDIFVMLFFTKVGEFTTEEFEAAFGHFTKNGRPLIYTYFKNAAIQTGEIKNDDLLSLLSFKNKLNDLGHFITEYKDEDDLNFQFSNQLDKLLKDNKI